MSSPLMNDLHRPTCPSLVVGQGHRQQRQQRTHCSLVRPHFPSDQKLGLQLLVSVFRELRNLRQWDGMARLHRILSWGCTNLGWQTATVGLLAARPWPRQLRTSDEALRSDPISG